MLEHEYLITHIDFDKAQSTDRYFLIALDYRYFLAQSVAIQAEFAVLITNLSLDQLISDSTLAYVSHYLSRRFEHVQIQSSALQVVYSPHLRQIEHLVVDWSVSQPEPANSLNFAKHNRCYLACLAVF